MTPETNLSCMERMIRLETQIDNLNERFNELKSLEKTTNDTNIRVVKMSEKLDNILSRVKDNEIRLDEIEKKPAKRWDSVIGTIIGALVASFIAWLMNNN